MEMVYIFSMNAPELLSRERRLLFLLLQLLRVNTCSRAQLGNSPRGSSLILASLSFGKTIFKSSLRTPCFARARASASAQSFAKADLNSARINSRRYFNVSKYANLFLSLAARYFLMKYKSDACFYNKKFIINHKFKNIFQVFIFWFWVKNYYH